MTSWSKSTKIPAVLFCTVLLADVFLQLSCFVRSLCAGISPSFMYRGQVLGERTFVREVSITEVTLVGDITMLDSFMVLGTADWGRNMLTEIALDNTYLFLFDLTWNKGERHLLLSIFIYSIFLSSFFFVFLLVTIFLFLLFQNLEQLTPDHLALHWLLMSSPHTS